MPNEEINCLPNQQKFDNPIFTSFIFELIRYNYVPVVINVFEFLSIPENISRYNSEKLFNTSFMYPLLYFGKNTMRSITTSIDQQHSEGQREIKDNYIDLTKLSISLATFDKHRRIVYSVFENVTPFEFQFFVATEDRSMAYNPALAYCIILLMSPMPNIAIISYINKKPLLTKVSLCIIRFIYISKIIKFFQISFHRIKQQFHQCTLLRWFLITITRI